MNNGIDKINQVVEYIEANLTEQIDCATLAKIATLSEYEFRRIFSFVIGTPIAEYIRKRRLSVAAEELKAGGIGIADVGAKYGYDSASSFTRAFKEQFGITPQEVKSPDVKLNIFMKPRFELRVIGGATLEYTEKILESFSIKGVFGYSSLNDTCCCESVWKQYEESETESGDGCIYAAYANGEKNVLCYIGEKQAFSDNDEVGRISVRSGKWLCFDVRSDAPESEVNDLYEKIMFSFLPSGIYEKDDSRPNIERFSPDGSFTVMIPVRRA